MHCKLFAEKKSKVKDYIKEKDDKIEMNVNKTEKTIALRFSLHKQNLFMKTFVGRMEKFVKRLTKLLKKLLLFFQFTKKS